ncbi:MAG: hydroxymethylglutaryl-CoA reductase, degradative, partial [Sinomicrobium sp.]|nr:hydroxymethylglutaryl-CoA reductase, degradative [Sinomicrobium sp.]
WNPDDTLQQLHNEFTENTITNYYLPYSIVPNFVIDGKRYTIPMVTEESSVIAAAGKAAKFWAARGGFTAKVVSSMKTGQIHFMYYGAGDTLKTYFSCNKKKILHALSPLTKSMEKRGGGLVDIELRDRTLELRNYYQIHCTFDTSEAMGANFINSCLEKLAETFKKEMKRYRDFTPEERNIDIIMSILSNYAPNCMAYAEASCKVAELNEDEIPPEEFAEKFVRAIDIAKAEPHRAATHNKGIMNGVDAVVLATGNDFRAVEAGAHSYAGRVGYSSLTHATVEKGIFKFWIEIPLVLGTVGGVTGLHPLAKLSLEMLGNPGTGELMKIVAVAGLAQNFAAIRSLITTGIQKGHMKMHLLNILNQLNASGKEKEFLMDYFKDKPITHTAVAEKLKKIQKKKTGRLFL